MTNSNSFSLKEILRSFARVYDCQRPAFISCAGGRVELIGGHTDYNEGFVIAAAIDKCCRVAAAERADNKIHLYSQWAQADHEFELSSDLEPLRHHTWVNYGKGIAALLLQEGLALKGANLYISSDVPVGAGLGSSAALEVSLANAMIRISWPENNIEPKRLAQICRKAENVYADSPCGIMDQSVSIMGKKGCAILLDCRDISVSYLPLKDSSCCVMIFNSMVKHEISGACYGERRRFCEQGCKVLSNRFPEVRALRDANESMLESVRDEMDSTIFSCARHIVDENARVLSAADALEQNDLAEFGRLMYASHCSARDLFKISCEQTDFLVEQVCQCDGAYGARISGGGFGGSVVALVRPEAVEKIGQSIHKAYKDKFGLDCGIYQATSSKGTQIIELK